MAEITVLPGVERRDIGHNVKVQNILESAAKENMHVVIVLGYGEHGWCLWGSSPDQDKNVGMLSRAHHEILHCEGAEEFTTDEENGA